MLFDPSNPNSMSSIYRELSYGNLEVTGEVIPYVRAPQPYKFYTAGKSGTGTSIRTTPQVCCSTRSLSTARPTT